MIRVLTLELAETNANLTQGIEADVTQGAGHRPKNWE